MLEFGPRLLTAACLAVASLPGQAVLGLVRTSTGDPVAGARVAFWPAAGETAPWREASAPPPPTFGQTDRSGRFRLETARGTGALVVEHPRDGGALVARCWTGVPVSVVARPLGTIELDVDVSIRLRARAADGGATFVGARRGAAIRLPAGDYVALVERQGRFAERACRVDQGARTRLAGPPEHPPLLIDSAARGELSLLDWPDVELVATDDGTWLPATDGLGKLRERLVNGSGAAFLDHSYDGRAERVRLAELETVWREVVVLDGTDRSPLQGARVLSIERIGERAHVRSHSTSDERGAAHILAVDAINPCTAIVWREGSAPWMRAQPVPDELLVEMVPARSLRLRVATPDPRLDGGTTVRIEQPPWDLVRTELANERGEVVFGDLAPAETRIRVEHPEFPPATRTIDLGSNQLERAVIELEPGLDLWGTVVLDGAPVGGAVVELRDASGGAGSTTRIVATDPAGSFRMRGLLDEAFTLFAHREAHGTTWSVRWSAARPGGSPYELVLVPEDPPLPGKRRGQ